MASITGASVATGLALAVVGLVAVELAARAAVRARTASLVADVIDPSDDLIVTVPIVPLLPSLLRRRVPVVLASCQRAVLPGVEMEQVRLSFVGLVIGARLDVVAGSGLLIAHIPAAEVLRRAGVPGSLEIGDGAVTVRWPRTGFAGMPRVGMRLRPTLVGDRIRLLPTPLSMSLPPLPRGTTLTTVEAGDAALVVTARLELPTLLNTR